MNDTELDNILNTWKVPAVPNSMWVRLQSRVPENRSRRLLGIPSRWFVAFVAAASALAIGAALIEDGTIMSDAGPWQAGLYMRRTRIVHPLLAKFGWSNKGGLSTGWQWQGNKLVGSVYMFDKSSHVHYGYTWNAEPTGTGQYLFTVLPLDPSVLREPGSIAPLVHPVPPIIVGPGNTFEVDIFNSPNERLYDRYELSGEPLSLPKPADPDLITLTNPRLYVNGSFVLDSGGVAEVSGNRVFVQLRNRGEYTLTLAPMGDARFLLAGTTKGKTIEFQSGGDVFRIVCTAPVTRGGERSVYLYLKADVNLRTSRFGGGGGPAPLSVGLTK